MEPKIPDDQRDEDIVAEYDAIPYPLADLERTYHDAKLEDQEAKKHSQEKDGSQRGARS